MKKNEFHCQLKYIKATKLIAFWLVIKAVFHISFSQSLKCECNFWNIQICQCTHKTKYQLFVQFEKDFSKNRGKHFQLNRIASLNKSNDSSSSFKSIQQIDRIQILDKKKEIHTFPSSSCVYAYIDV